MSARMNLDAAPEIFQGTRAGWRKTEPRANPSLPAVQHRSHFFFIFLVLNGDLSFSKLFFFALYAVVFVLEPSAPPRRALSFAFDNVHSLESLSSWVTLPVQTKLTTLFSSVDVLAGIWLHRISSLRTLSTSRAL